VKVVLILFLPRRFLDFRGLQPFLRRSPLLPSQLRPRQPLSSFLLILFMSGGLMSTHVAFLEGSLRIFPVTQLATCSPSRLLSSPPHLPSPPIPDCLLPRCALPGGFRSLRSFRSQREQDHLLVVGCRLFPRRCAAFRPSRRSPFLSWFRGRPRRDFYL